MTIGYPFPSITSINDVLPHIKGRDEFVVVEKEGDYTVINYVYQTPETFPPVFNEVVLANDAEFQGRRYDYDHGAAILRECRGIIFRTSTGEIIARRFHKFFNEGERQDQGLSGLELVQLEDHVIADKLDGSMITPIPVAGGIRWGTKMGVTDVALPVEEFVASRPNYVEFATNAARIGVTPIFEWCSRRQRIVLDYPEDQLVLLAARWNYTGHYIPRDQLENWGRSYDIPVVGTVPVERLFREALHEAEGVEGYVLQLRDGHMLKFKTSWYVQLHKTKELIGREHNVAALFLDQKIDDLLPALAAEDRARVEEYIASLATEIQHLNAKVHVETLRAQEIGRKEFAIASEANAASDPRWQQLRHLVFKCFDGKVTTADAILNYLRKHAQTSKNWEHAKSLLLNPPSFIEFLEAA